MKEISAPGKLVLAGEYAVLEGHPALAMAVDRRVILKPSKEKHESELWQSVLSCHSGLDPESRNRSDKFWIPHQVWDDKVILRTNDSQFNIDSSELYEQENKLGLGSSAAVSVCMAAYLEPENAYELARKAHKKFSNSLGSGIDIAASYHGGLIKFQDGKSKKLKANFGELELNFVHTGKSQNTRDFLKKVLEYKASNPKNYEKIISKLGALTDCWQRYYCKALDTKSTLDISEENLDLLRELGQKSKISIITKEQEKLCKLSKKLGGNSKPSGAGGGDISLCFIPKEKQSEFNQSLNLFGFKKLNLAISNSGLRAN